MTSENGLAPRMAFQGGEPFPFSRPEGEQSGQRAVRAAAGFGAADGDKMFSGGRDAGFFRDLHPRPPPSQRWGGIMDGRSHSGDGPMGEDEEDEDEDGDDEDDDVDDGDALVSLEEGNNKVNYNSSGSVQSSSEKICDERAISQEHHSSFGLSRGVLPKDGSGGRGGLGEQSYQDGRMDGGQNVAGMEPEPYYAHILPGGDGSSHHKEVRRENGCGFNGRREAGLAGTFWETLRTQLSDPITGMLMEDAMLLSCGHSFGISGLQHVYKMKTCYTCSQPISEFSVRPNLTLRAAVQAFRREDELKASRRKRDKFEQEKFSYNDSFSMDLSRGKGVQFPFAVSDKVVIKGNKRTPQRFVGRVAVVTTQCLNGWYVVKTLDNAESVKLQYRSLEKLLDDQGPNTMSDKTHTPNWL